MHSTKIILIVLGALAGMGALIALGSVHCWASRKFLVDPDTRTTISLVSKAVATTALVGIGLTASNAVKMSL